MHACIVTEMRPLALVGHVVYFPDHVSLNKTLPTLFKYIPNWRPPCGPSKLQSTFGVILPYHDPPQFSARIGQTNV